MTQEAKGTVNGVNVDKLFETVGVIKNKLKLQNSILKQQIVG